LFSHLEYLLPLPEELVTDICPTLRSLTHHLNQVARSVDQFELAPPFLLLGSNLTTKTLACLGLPALSLLLFVG
jgi:hypothetical protein